MICLNLCQRLLKSEPVGEAGRLFALTFQGPQNAALEPSVPVWPTQLLVPLSQGCPSQAPSSCFRLFPSSSHTSKLIHSLSHHLSRSVVGKMAN